MTLSQTTISPRAPGSGVADHIRALLLLGLPLVGSNLAQFSLHLTDTVMVGWYGTEALAALVLASGLFFVLYILGSGFSFALMGRAAAALGAGDETQLRRDTRMTLWLSLGFGVLAMPAAYHGEALLRALGQAPETSALAGSYLRVAMWGLVPELVLAVFRAYLSAFEKTRAVLWVTLAGVALNALLNWALIFGHWGAPEMGVQGAALASVLVAAAAAVVLALYALRLPELRRFHLLQRFWRPDREGLEAIARLGVPVGLTSLAETGMFQASAVMMGWLGTVPLAAHGIVLSFISLVFMAHLGLAGAATVRAGRAYGRGDRQGLRRGAAVALGMSLSVAAVTVCVFLTVPEFCLRLFLDTSKPEAPEIVAYGVSLLTVAALFQLFDATQVMMMGVLRGVLDTRGPMEIAAVCYWLIGVPASYLLAFRMGLGGVGLWIGLLSGLGCTAGLLLLRFWRKEWIAPRRS